MKAPLRWPNSSLSIRFSGRAPQLIATNGMSARRLWSCTARATSSLPVPVSPRISTVELVGATLAISCRTRCMARPSPIRSRFTLDAFQLSFQGAILVRQFAFLGDALQERFQFDQLARFGQVVEGAVPQRGDGRLERRLAGQHDRLGVGRQLLRPGDDLDAVHARHVEIDEQAVVGVPFQRGDGRRAVGADGHLVSHARQFQAHQFLEAASSSANRIFSRLGGLLLSLVFFFMLAQRQCHEEL